MNQLWYTISFAFPVAAVFLFGKPSYKAQLDSKNQEIAKIKVGMDLKKTYVVLLPWKHIISWRVYLLIIEDVNGRCQKM